MKTRHTYIILAVVFASFFALGMPDGAFGVAWPSIRGEMGQPLERAGIAVLIHSFFYALTSSLLGRISGFVKLEKIALIGAATMALGFFGVSLAPNFAAFALIIAPVGVGMGMVDSSLNSYVVKSFTSRHLNWLHCFWGLGAATTPLLMTQMILTFGWRTGYIVIAAAQGAIALTFLTTLLKGIWAKVESGRATSTQATDRKRYLIKKRHQFMAIASCFLYGGVEYSIGFWITSVLLESRGFGLERVGMYPAVYFASITGGRMVFGFIANKFSDTAIIRFGFSLSIAGLLILFLTGNIFGMALAGLGFAPIFPCIMHDNSNRFDPKIVTKLVGYEVAAIGAGVAILSALIGQVLSRVSLEALFPISIALAAITLLLNESLALTAKRNGTLVAVSADKDGEGI